VILINPGSENNGGTIDESLVIANEFLEIIHNEGLLEVELLPDAKVFPHGRWEYTFRHSVTGKTATLDTHGFTVDEMSAFTFSPRTYWNGSSTSCPVISDFITDEFSYRVEFYRKP
jgi:hypothetical protein